MTLMKEIGQGHQVASFSVYGVFGWKKEIGILQHSDPHLCTIREGGLVM
jgi:hypothetical protein